MNSQQIQRLKDTTMRPPIFSSMRDVDQMRYDAEMLEMGIGGTKNSSNKWLAYDLRKRAFKLEKELFVESLQTPTII